MKEIVKNNAKHFIYAFSFMVTSIIIAGMSFSYAAEEAGNNIFTRDELSEKIGNVETTLNNHSTLISNLEVNTTTNKMFLNVNPVGSIYTSISPTNPGTIYGGTWVSFGSGKTLVGVNESEVEFNTVEKTGGDKSTTILRSNLPLGTVFYDNSPTIVHSWGTLGLITNIENTYTAIGHHSNVAGDAPMSNLQPYITVYMWKRTA